MTIASNERADARRIGRTALAAAVMIGSFALGGCVPSMSARHGVDLVANPLTDQQAMSQVVDPARQIVRFAHLPQVHGAFTFASCNEHGDLPYQPPFRGIVEMSFTLPAGHQANAYPDQIAATMVARGWADGPPTGLNPVGRVINRDGVVGAITMDPQTEWGKVQLQGECRNVTGHGDQGRANWSDVTDQLNQR